MHLLICVSVLLQTFDDRQMTDNWTQSHKHKTKTQEAWQRAIKSKEKFKEEVEDNFFRDWFSVKMFLNLFLSNLFSMSINKHV